MHRLLDNIAWNSLRGRQAHFATGRPHALRYSPGFSAILGFEDPAQPDFPALAPYCEPGEQFYLVGWSGVAPPDWKVVEETTIIKMLWDAAMPATDDAAYARPMGAGHVLQAMELAALTHPGPFGPRTIEMGEYWGFFEGERLIAMAGERMHAGHLREISGVCTTPQYQGRGLALRLMQRLIRHEMQRGETPFLHVMHDNRSARRLYTRMGFRDYSESVVRVIEYSP
jgi:ribosomal protein S18 acetylase RimI-like enzyme